MAEWIGNCFKAAQRYSISAVGLSRSIQRAFGMRTHVVESIHLASFDGVITILAPSPALPGAWRFLHPYLNHQVMIVLPESPHTDGAGHGRAFADRYEFVPLFIVVIMMMSRPSVHTMLKKAGITPRRIPHQSTGHRAISSTLRTDTRVAHQSVLLLISARSKAAVFWSGQTPRDMHIRALIHISR